MKLKCQKSINFFQVGIFLIMTGLLHSRLMLSLGILILFINALWAYPLKETWNAFIRQPFLLSITSLFFIYFLTGLYSSDAIEFWQRIRIALPLLFLPFSFAKNHLQSETKWRNWLYYFFVLVLISAVKSTLVLWERHESFNIIFQEGVYIPVPIHHVRFSMMIAFSIFIGYYLILHYKFTFFWETILLKGGIIFLFLYLHLISVRTGLVGFYTTIALLYFRSIRNCQTYKIIGHVLLILLTFYLISNFFLGFKLKLLTSIDSIIALYNNTTIDDYSDYYRFQSIKDGFSIFAEHPFFGVGIGDLQTEIIKLAEQRFEKSTILPHNQFVFHLSFSGLFGLVWFGLVILYL